MTTSRKARLTIAPAVLAAVILLRPGPAPALEGPGPKALLPSLPGWVEAEETQRYQPETLFEYINGAAESYLAYDFRELAVGQFRKEGSAGSLTVEVYDMGQPRNAFGIYGTERYPESRFVQVGVQGYLEEGLLNFLAGRYYVKLMCYDCGAETESVLETAARDAAGKAGEIPGFPDVLSAFPRAELVANSEKFVLKNFLGQSFLEAGYTALYRREGREFECFIMEAGSGEEAEAMLRKLVERAAAESLPGLEGSYRWRDRYLGNMYLLRSGRFLCGLMRVPDGGADSAGPDLAFMARETARLKR